MTWFDIIDRDGTYVAEAEGIANAQCACETIIVADGYRGELKVVAFGEHHPVATATFDERHQLFLWRSSDAELRYRNEGRQARR